MKKEKEDACWCDNAAKPGLGGHWCQHGCGYVVCDDCIGETEHPCTADPIFDDYSLEDKYLDGDSE